MDELEKWQEEYLVQIKEMTNREALDEYAYLSGGDDYDGALTKKGEWKWPKIEKEFLGRLDAYGFFGRRTVLTEKWYNRK